MRHWKQQARLVVALLCCCLLPALPAQAAQRVLMLGVAPVQPGKFEHMVPLAAEAGFELEYRFLDREEYGPLQPEQLTHDLIVVDAPYGPALAAAQQHLQPLLPQLQQPWLWLRADGSRGEGLDAQRIAVLEQYYRQGGEHNYRGFFCRLAAQTPEEADSCPVLREFPSAALYHPQLPGDVFADLPAFLDWKGIAADDSRPLVVVLFHKASMDNGLTAHLDALLHRLEQGGAIAVGLYSATLAQGEIQQLLMVDQQLRANVLISMQIMLNAEGRRSEFEELGLPVLQALTYRRGEQQDWEQDAVGLPTQDIPFYLAQPEYAGLIDPLVFAAVRQSDGEMLAIDRQLSAVSNKAMRLARLQQLPNGQKRLALFFYNYPPGEKNLGASFLNVPRSLERLLPALAEAGYEVEGRDEQQLIDSLTRLLGPLYRDDRRADLLDPQVAARLPLQDYLDWFGQLPQGLQDDITGRWGPPEQAGLLLRDGAEAFFAIPRLQLGQLAILPQLPRGEAEQDRERALYHDTRTPPSHSYLAGYLWARESFASDALIHFGTHGTYEWQPGKERGLDVLDYPYLTVGDVPVLYPYIVDNIGEALQTKRRGRAVTISHNTPAFSPAGLHGTLVEIHDLLHDWMQMTEGEVRDVTATDIIRHVVAENLHLDMGVTEAQARAEFGHFAEQLHDHVHELALDNQPLGLATFGQPSEPDLRLLTLLQMLGRPLLEQLDPEGPEEQLVDDYQKIQQTPAWQLLDRHVRNAEPWTGDDDMAALLTQARDWWQLLGDNREIAGLLTGLQGRHLPVSYGGDPIKNPDSLPTGRNLYGFDPSRIPTPQAWEAGRQAAERLLQTHLESHGEYPQKLAFSLWSVETMRHFGILEAQVFALLGFEPQWDAGGRVVGIRAIERQALGRPRVDTVISATGLYRDHFPNVMHWLAQAAEQAALLDEHDNAVAQNSQRIEQQLLDAGWELSEARLAARTRIFSSASGAYGTGLDDATLASDSFGETDDGGQDRHAGDAKLAELYLQRMQYAYGPDSQRWGQKSDLNLYAEHLRGTQGAILSRSSNLYGMLTTDDPFQYLGGIGLAVRHLDGSSPQLYISNLRDSAQARVETAAGFLARDLRARYFHPGWISRMQKEGYSGTLEVLGTANNLWGWQVTAPETVRDDQWQEFKAVYVDDKYQLDVNQWFEQHNPHAQAQMIERLLEAARKEYWSTDADTLQQLAERWQALAERFDVRSDNPRFNQFVGAAAAGYGLQPAAWQPDSTAEAVAGSQAELQRVQGQRLQPQAEAAQADPQPLDATPLLAMLLMLLALAAGAVRQSRQGTSPLFTSRSQ
ncbi:MAG: cobaltochelatase subunit CobN [Halopseudomonas yangmingensis]|uniref:Cobaltochelatase CobN n=1 Tax=Halopseudomonas yangmingensis TaxID=1720063 RepID=A0A1I4RXS6_9GAMM|nr:cobaltochelatase subunit CobN [Halopseudomonas yangmingensis]SFM57039.1 cobaltochelatase CobN [Halopseudomonas yangmingensis]